MALNFDYAAARNAGYSDEQILQGLKTHGELDFDVDSALKQYSASDILQGILPKPPAPAAKPADTTVMDRIKDMGISALKGAIGVPESAVGLADIVTGGYAGKGAEALGFRPAEAKSILNDYYSEAQKTANQKVADAKGFMPTVGEMVSNPSTLVQTGLESLPSMGAGGVVGRGVMAVAPKIAGLAGGAMGGAIGEGTVGAGQAAEQIRQANPDGTMSLGQSGAALASGIGDTVFAAVGGRIAHKLGIADIDTVLAGANAPVSTSKGVVRRMIEGGISEGVFEELPQNIQEQMWQNVAMDKPLMDGVPEQAAQGMLAGGLFGGFAGAALHGKPHAATEQPAAEPLLLGNTPDPFLSFPDGSVGRKSDAEAFINNLPEHERLAARSRLFGMQEQTVTPTDVLQAQSVDDAIAIANKAIEQGTPEFQEQRNSDIDAAWLQHLTDAATQRQVEFTAAEEQRRAAETQPLLNQVADQNVEQANAATNVQGFDQPAPTAMQLAMQEAQARRTQATAATEQPASIESLQQGESNGQQETGQQVAGGTAAGNIEQTNAPIGNAGANGEVRPSTISGGTQGAGPINENTAGRVQGDSVQQAATVPPEAVAQAKSVLTAAGVTGNERMAALRSIRTGENTIEDLIDAHPPKLQEAANVNTSAINDGGIGNVRGGSNSDVARNGLANSGRSGATGPVSGNGQGVTGLASGESAVNLPSTSNAANQESPLAKVSGKQIDAKWTEFAHDSGTLGIGRDQMPQVKAEHRGALTQFLAARGITHETTEVPAGDLKPTQREYSTEKVQSAKDYQGGDRSILVSSDNHILDGHHQWLAKLDAGEPVKVIRLDAPIRELLAQVHDFPSSETARGTTSEGVQNATQEVSQQSSIQGERPQGSSSGETNEAGGSNSVQRTAGIQETGLTKSQQEVERLRSARDERIAAQREKPKTEQQIATETKFARQEAEIAKAKANAEERKAAKEPSPQIAEKPSGKVVERYLGRYGQGMSQNNANVEASQRNKANNGVKWTVEPNEDLGYDRHEVVGRKEAPLKSESGKSFRKDIQERNPGVKLDVSDSRNTVTVSRIVVPEPQRGEGIGRKVMQDIIDHADSIGKPVALTPSADFGGSVPRLREFYKSMGFVENKGRNADYEISESMYRPVPNEARKSQSLSTGGLTVAAVNKAIVNLKAKWLGFTKVNTVQSIEDLPADIRERASADAQTEGVYDPQTKSVYLIADNIASPERAAWVAAHETIGHGGLRMLKDKSVNEALNIAGGNKYIKELASAIQEDRGGDVSQSTSVEEAIAELSAATESGNFAALEDRYGVKVPTASRNGVIGAVARVYDAVKRFLASVTGRPVAEVSDADVRALIGEQQAAVEGRRDARESAPDTAPARASVIRPSERTIEVDGQRRPIMDSTGKQIARGDVAAQRRFYEWFGDSEVVDSKGHPLVVYHGTTSEFTDFKKGQSEWTDGIFFTSSRNVATNVYAGGMDSLNVQGLREKLDTMSPEQIEKVLDKANSSIRGFEYYEDFNSKEFDARGDLIGYLESEFDQAEGLGQKVDRVMEAFGVEPRSAAEGSRVINAYMSLQKPLIVDAEGDSFDHEQQSEWFKKAKAGGHDGIIVKNYEDGGFGSAGSYTSAGKHTVYIAFKPTQVKAATGNNGNFDPNENSILKSSAPAAPREVIPKWAENESDAVKTALRKAGIIYTEETFKQKVKALTDGAMKKLQYGILDQFAPIKDQLGKIPYVMARMAKNADGTLEALMLYGRPHLDSEGGMLVDTTKKGFIETMQTLNGEHDRFFSWMAGRRAEQLKKEGRENLFTNEDISALSTLNQGTMKDGTSREAAYLRAQKDVAELNKSVLDIAEKSGLIDGESRKVWASDFYVPFYRVMEEGVTGPSIKSGLVNQKSIKKLKGGTNNLGDLTQNMLMNWSTLLTASAKNRAAKASLDAATQIGAATEADEATIRQMGKAASTKAVSYMENGVNRWHVVEDEHLLAAISALEFNGYNNQAMKVMSTFKNYLTVAVTSMPGFKVRNLIRDSISTIGVSQAGNNPFANVWNGGKSLLNNKDLRAQLVAGGGVFRFGTTMEGNRAENIKRLIDSGVADDTILNTAQKMTAFTKKLWHGYQEFGDLSENVNRAALYEKLRGEGMSHLEASFEARDLMDFGLSGAWAGVRALNQVLPFFNARLQGFYKLGRAYNDDPRRLGYVVGAVALASIALLAAYKDDDDFKKRSEADRNNYWWFKVGDVAYRIPRPFEIGAMGSALEHLTALAIDQENTNAKRFANQLGDIVNSQLAMNPIPQVFRPLIDIYSNKDSFTGRPIENMAMQRLKPEDRYSYNTSELARMLSKSGMIVDPVSLVAGTGVKQLSPVQIDALIKGYFSGAGTLATAAVDGLLHHSVIDRGEALPATIKTFAGSFAESLPTNSSRYVDMLYSTAQDIEQSYASYRNAIKNGDIEKARQIMKDDGENIAKYHLVESLKKNETKINQQIQRVMNSKELTGLQKEETIRRLKVEQDKIARVFATRQ